jgi:hypothetical protein
MKVKIFILEYGEKMNGDLLTKSVTLSGYPSVEFQSLSLSPLAKALNTGLKEFQKGYDFIGFLANDIEEPQNWLLKRINHLKENISCGIVSIYPGENIPTGSPDIIGNYLIRKELFEKIGYFTEDFKDYGPIDLDYCTRARVSGFSTDYIQNEKAVHFDSGEDMVYGFSKKEAVKESWPIHVKNVIDYHGGKNPIKIYPEYTINENEWPNINT